MGRMTRPQQKAMFAKLLRQKRAARFIVKTVARPLALTTTFNKEERLKVKQGAQRIEKVLDREIKQLEKRKLK